MSAENTFMSQTNIEGRVVSDHEKSTCELKAHIAALQAIIDERMEEFSIDLLDYQVQSGVPQWFGKYYDAVTAPSMKHLGHLGGKFNADGAITLRYLMSFAVLNEKEMCKLQPITLDQVRAYIKSRI